MLSKSLALFGLAASASAHILMTNPVPFGNPNNSPLDASGSDFPCKGLHPDGSVPNKYKAGSTQQLHFQGTAVHGGGSCQVSVTTDKNPTKDSKWKVIKSIEGGCPAKNQEGNLPGNNANGAVPYTYGFDIPKDMADGEYTLAWTWFNKVGNREMYMNCASVEITGGSGDKSFMDSLPDMFVANVGNGCGTVDSKDVKFPDPGQDVDKFNGKTQAFAAPTGNCAAPGGGSGSSPTTAPEPTSPPAPTSASSRNPAPTASNPGGIFITVPTSATPTPTPTPSPSPSPSPSPQPNPGNGGGDGGSAFEAGTPCSSEGTWNCIGGSSFQRCASGIWSEVQPMAAGMSCDSGQSSEFRFHAAAAKRGMRRAHRIRS